MVGAYDVWRHKDDELHWSDITFAIWQGVTSMSGLDPKKISFIGQGTIKNVVSEAIIDRVAPLRTRVTTYVAGDVEFSALLGTPNGMGGVYFLMQHKQALGFKTISQVTIIRDLTGEANLIFDVAELEYSVQKCWGELYSNGSALEGSHINASVY